MENTQNTSNNNQINIPIKSKSFYTSKKFLVVISIVFIVVLVIFLVNSFNKERSSTQSSTNLMVTPSKFINNINSQIQPTNTLSQAKFSSYEESGKMKDGTFVTTDTDGDSLPDWLEKEMGTNSQVFECSEHLRGCGNGIGFTGKKFDRQNVIIVLDSSGSMGATNNGKTRLDIAKEAVLQYVTQFQGTTVNVGLIVYGHKGNNTEAGKQTSCTSIETIYQPSKFTSSTFQTALQSFHPTGWTPIASSLAVAKAELEKIPSSSRENSAILLVTDGEETCGGDPVVTAKSIRESGMQVVVDVVALGTDAATNVKLEPIAKAGGGVFLAVQDEEQLKQKMYETFKVAQKETANVIACSGAVILKWVSCRQDVLKNKFYPYVNSISKSDPNYIVSGMNDFLMSFDKNKVDIFNQFTSQTNDEVKKAEVAQNSAADIYKDNSNTYQP